MSLFSLLLQTKGWEGGFLKIQVGKFGLKIPSISEVMANFVGLSQFKLNRAAWGFQNNCSPWQWLGQGQKIKNAPKIPKKIWDVFGYV